MRKISITFAFFLMMSVHNAEAVEGTCQTKSQECKAFWQKLGPTPDQNTCDTGSAKCLNAKQACKEELPKNPELSKQLSTAKTYHLAVKQACQKPLAPKS